MGAAGMAKAGRLRDCVLAMDAVLPCPVTIKIRTGLDKAEASRFAHKLVAKARLWSVGLSSACGGGGEGALPPRSALAAITIHGRTRQQRYSSYADWAYIQRCAAVAGAPVVHMSPQHLWEAGYGARFECPSALAAWGVAEGEAGAGARGALARAAASGCAPSSAHAAEVALRPPTIPVIGNGDILSWQDWYRHLGEEVGEGGGGGAPPAPPAARLATCMLARGALIKPWLPTEIRERRDWDISSRERLDILREYTAAGLEHWGSDAQGVAKTRKFLLEWLSFLHRYVPVGLLERAPQLMGDHAPAFSGRDDLETLMASNAAEDWARISEMLLGPCPPGFRFVAKHKSSGSSARADAEG